MTLGIVIVMVLLCSFAVLFTAMNIYRRQRMLEDKKAEYHSLRMKNSSHWSLFRKSQANIDRLHTLFKDKQTEIIALLQNIENDKKEIKETLEILKKEAKQTSGDLGGDLERIVERRKILIKKHWLTMNGKKVMFVERRKELQSLMASVEREKTNKDKEYAKWVDTKDRLAHLKSEYEQISTKPFFSFSAKKDRQ
jgi:hypothetical protein